MDRGEVFVGTELFASVFVGALLGWFVGQLFGIKSPWPLLVGFAIGALAGFREIYHYIKWGIERERSGEFEKQGSGSAERPTV